MARTYRIINGFNVKIPDDGKDADYGPGTVVQFGDAFEVRYEAGDEAFASRELNLPKGVTIKHMIDTGALEISGGTPEPEADEADEPEGEND